MASTHNRIVNLPNHGGKRFSTYTNISLDTVNEEKTVIKGNHVASVVQVNKKFSVIPRLHEDKNYLKELNNVNQEGTGAPSHIGLEKQAVRGEYKIKTDTTRLNRPGPAGFATSYRVSHKFNVKNKEVTPGNVAHPQHKGIVLKDKSNFIVKEYINANENREYYPNKTMNAVPDRSVNFVSTHRQELSGV